MVVDYYVRSDIICLRFGVEDELFLFVENFNLKIGVFRWIFVVCFWWEICGN